jgi:cystathionine beta-lyase
MKFDFDTLPNRRESESAKWNAYGDDLLPMWVADMDFLTPEPVIQALRDRADHGVFGYALPPEGIKDVVMEWLHKRYGWAVNAEDLILVPGVVAGFNLASHSVTRPGDGVVLQTPTYGPFFSVAENVNLIQQEMELTQGSDGQYYIDYDAFEASMTGRSRIFMLCNPQNPTGRVFLRDELEKMAEICLKHDVIICSDEIHSDLVFSESRHLPIASLSSEIALNTITLIAPSKTFNIAGLKTSVAIITNEELRKKFDNARKGLLGSVNLMGLYAAMAAYKDGEDWLDELLLYLENNRDFLHSYIQKELPEISMAKPEGTFLAWLDCREAGIEGKPSEYFKGKAKVLMNDGEWFGKGGEGFVRLNFGCPRSMLSEALVMLKDALPPGKG